MRTSATWFPVPAEGATTLDRMIGHRPAYAAAFRDVEEALWGQDVLDPAILELCRLRIAQLLGADGERRFAYERGGVPRTAADAGFRSSGSVEVSR